MKPAEYWDSDPPETIMFLRAFIYARDQLRRELIKHAWQTAGLHRAKGFPQSVTKLLPPELDERNRPMRRRQYASPKHEWAMWEAFALRANTAAAQQDRMNAHEKAS
jgi:hypothetical protein